VYVVPIVLSVLMVSPLLLERLERRLPVLPGKSTREKGNR
jgi:hypothetical protein